MDVLSPLLLVSDAPVLHAEVTRLAAAAGVVVEVHGTSDPVAVSERWRTALAVLVGSDATRWLADRSPPRRDDVRVVEVGASSEEVLRAALEVGAAALVELPVDAARLGAWLSDLADRSVDTVASGRVLGVLGASGGVGASVTALAVAELAAQQEPALLVGLDPWGLPAGVLAGASSDGAGPISWSDLAELDGRVGARALRESLPSRERLRVLGWTPGQPIEAAGLPERVVREVVTAARRGHGWVVLDVPRSPATRGLLTLCDAVAVVASATLAGTAGAARVGSLVPPGVSAGVVVRTERGALPGDVARLAGLPLWGVLGPQRGLDEHLAAGLGAVRSRRSPCARTARAVLGAVTQAVGARA